MDENRDSKFDAVTTGGLAAAGAGAGLGAAADLVVPGLGSITSVAVQSVLNLSGRAVERRRLRAARALQLGSDFAHVDITEVEAAAQTSDRKLELALLALSAASQSALEAKIAALGRAMVTGVLARDEAIVDQEFLIVQALAGLEAPHVRVLDLCRGSSQVQRNGRAYDSRDLAWTPERLASEYRGAAPVMPALLAALVSAGAVRDISVGRTDYHPTYESSPFGNLLLARLEQAGRDEAAATGDAEPAAGADRLA
ncbi:hypothetical protein ENKNEFLB_01951 [Nocardioides aquaticus]|uniref:DUF4393 domain-containing protein n=1 Tax=Nocardioides aquaticus TaxID=160826 RepID=A0ABX8EKH3_9ACTN|nr:hypothetical protein [Nocardioides aquaticus]QVT79568.1 hypothetical protein ENKNEFLB_01951 [Nocardioides aquaticus]